MHDHNRTMRVLEHALGVGAQHPAMKDGVAALAHHNEAGLDGICPVDDLFRRMAHDNLSFEFNLLLPRALADGREAALIALPHVLEDRVEFRALGGLRRPDYGQDEQLGFYILPP